jgi:protein SCO1
MRTRAWPAWLALLALPAASASAPMAPPDLLQRAGIEQKLGAQVPPDARFRDADGKTVNLAAVSAGRPVLLALGYYRCPNLCDVVLHGIARAVARIDLQPGRDVEVVFVSIDPHETPADAARSQAMLARADPHAHVAQWHFLSGDAGAIRALAKAVGFRYFRDPRNGEYAHAAAAVVLTGSGRVAQYYYGVSYPPASLRLALVGASAGRLGNPIDRLVLLCCGYDPTTGRYSLLIGRLMQLAGVAFVLLLALWLLWLRRRSRA